jgi:hypothetical protein
MNRSTQTGITLSLSTSLASLSLFAPTLPPVSMKRSPTAGPGTPTIAQSLSSAAGRWESSRGGENPQPTEASASLSPDAAGGKGSGGPWVSSHGGEKRGAWDGFEAAEAEGRCETEAEAGAELAGRYETEEYAEEAGRNEIGVAATGSWTRAGAGAGAGVGLGLREATASSCTRMTSFRKHGSHSSSKSPSIAAPLSSSHRRQRRLARRMKEVALRGGVTKQQEGGVLPSNLVRAWAFFQSIPFSSNKKYKRWVFLRNRSFLYEDISPLYNFLYI